MFIFFLQKLKKFFFYMDFYLYILFIFILIFYLFLNKEYLFLLLQIFVFICLLIIVITDDRFSINRKIFFIFLTLSFWLISFFIDKAPILLIKDLFWYSLVLNGSFIFHVLILNRLFEYSWKNHYEYAGFVISRISYFCSLWGIYNKNSIRSK